MAMGDGVAVGAGGVSADAPSWVWFDRHSGCAGKARYATAAEAYKVAKHLRRHANGVKRRQKKGSTEVQAYRCEACAGWHLGNRRD